MRNERKAAGLLVLIAMIVTLCCSQKPAETKAAAAGEMKPVAAHGTSAAPAGLTFNPPAGWISETPSSSMRQAQYRLPRAEGDAEDADLVVYFFQGQGGPVQANIDRWIGQFSKADGSPANDIAKISKKDVRGIALNIVDVSGTYSGSGGPMMAEAKPKANFRMIAAVAQTSGGPWFFKLTGPAKTVAKWEASYQAFLDSIQQ